MKKYVSIKYITSEVLDMIPNTDLVRVDLINEWASQAFKKLYNYKSIVYCLKNVPIENYTGIIDFHYETIKAVMMHKDGVLNFMGVNAELLRLLKSNNELNLDIKVCTETYSICDNIIKTSFDEGEVFIYYSSIPTDSEGDFIIPHHPDLVDAVTSYVMFKYYQREFNTNTEGAGQRMQYYQAQWQGYYNSLKIAYQMPDEQEMLKLSDLFTLSQKDKASPYLGMYNNEKVIL